MIKSTDNTPFNPGENDPAQKLAEVALYVQAQRKKDDEQKAKDLDKIEASHSPKPYHAPQPGLALKIARFFNLK